MGGNVAGSGAASSASMRARVTLGAGAGAFWASARSEGSGPEAEGAGALLPEVSAGAIVTVWLVVRDAVLTVLVELLTGFAGAALGGGVTATAATAGAALPSAAGKERTRASLVRSIVGSVLPRRSKTTRATGFGAGLNWATRTRSTTLPSTWTVERGLRLITPPRSTTNRGGSESAKVEYGNSPSPAMRITAPPVEASTSTAWSCVAAEPAGAGPDIGWSGVPAAAGGAVPAGGAAALGLAPVAAGSSWSGSNASFPLAWASTGSSWIRSLLPSAVTACSTSCRVAITRRVSGREPSSLFWTASEEISPSSGERSTTLAPGTEFGSSMITRPSALRKLVQTRGALASRSTKISGAPSRRSRERISTGAPVAGLTSALLVARGDGLDHVGGHEDGTVGTEQHAQHHRRSDPSPPPASALTSHDHISHGNSPPLRATDSLIAHRPLEAPIPPNP